MAHRDVVEVLSEFVGARHNGTLEDPLVKVLVVAVQPEQVENQLQPLYTIHKQYIHVKLSHTSTII